MNTVSTLLLVAALVAFAVAAFTTIAVSGVVLVPAGLAALTGSALIDRLG